MGCEAGSIGSGLQGLCCQLNHKAPEGVGDKRAGPKKGNKRACH